MAERLNAYISAVLKTHWFSSSKDLKQTLLRYVDSYNHQLPQSALKSKSLMQAATKKWKQSQPMCCKRAVIPS